MTQSLCKNVLTLHNLAERMWNLWLVGWFVSQLLLLILQHPYLWLVTAESKYCAEIQAKAIIIPFLRLLSMK